MNNLENTDNKEQRAEKSPMGGFPDKPGHGRGLPPLEPVPACPDQSGNLIREG